MLFSKQVVGLFFALLGSTLAVDRKLSTVRRARNTGKSGKTGKTGKTGKSSSGTLTLEIINLTRNQPFSPFFVMTHNEDATPLFAFGAPASAALARLAEDGDPAPLIALYNGMDGVGSVAGTMGPTFPGPGMSSTITVEVTKEYPLVTIASMFIHTNDGFIAINGRELEDGDRIFLPGYDAGSEANNELCTSIPGPSCNAIATGNVASGGGEGYVFVHPGFFGLNDMAGTGLPQAPYDWRNPMAYVIVSEA